MPRRGSLPRIPRRWRASITQHTRPAALWKIRICRRKRTDRRRRFGSVVQELPDHRLYHELCHIRPALDGNGNQKRDTKDRLLWRLGRHPIAAFPEEIARFGVDRVVGHNAAIVRSAESAGRPMFKTFDEAEEKTKGKGEVKKDAWRRWGIAKLELDLAVEDYVVKAGLDTIGALSDFMGKHGDFWDKDLRVGGESKPRNLRAKVDAAYAQFWQQHPEFCT